jgi:hypothetical protein
VRALAPVCARAAPTLWLLLTQQPRAMGATPRCCVPRFCRVYEPLSLTVRVRVRVNLCVWCAALQYLDSQISPMDIYYLEDQDLARQLVELGVRSPPPAI